MKQPDWSTASEWATVCVRHKGAQPLFAWAEEYKEDAKFLRDDGILGHKLMLEYWIKVDTRPTTPQWNGEGLPPVGVVCVLRVKREEHEGGWMDAEIMYSSKTAVVWRWEGRKEEFGAEWREVEFRPIRTPEQIAAEERGVALKAVCNDCPYPGSGSTAIDCEALYDKGYRKIAEDKQ